MPTPRDLGVLAVKSGHLGIWCYEKLRSRRRSVEHSLAALASQAVVLLSQADPCLGLGAACIPCSRARGRTLSSSGEIFLCWALLETVCPLPQHNIDHREVSELCVCPEVAALPWWHPEPSSW